jgi:Xaa-Pro aminopeptidase
MGISTQPIRTGEPIIFDIFPQAGSAYWYDLTRTYVVGRPKKTLRLMHEAVLEAQETCLDEIRAGRSAREVADVSYNIVERHGFPTVRTLLKGDQRARTTGFIHGLGHGVGLTIGERPYLSIFSDEMLTSGHVVTVEPGVYDPRVGGVRIEDTIFVTSNGFSNPARLPKDLEI